MNAKQKQLVVKDHTVSGEEFELIYNSSYQLLETHPQPDLDKLESYYKSEDYISHTDAKRNILEIGYHFVRGIALKRKLNLINSFKLSNKRLLDVGCGTGDFLHMALNNNWEVTGIEPNTSARAIANSKVNNAVYAETYLHKFENNSFDVITLWHVLEHLPNLETHINVLNKLLKPKGRLIIAVPNYKSFDAQYYKSYWAAYDVPRHLWHFSKESIQVLFNRVHMTIEYILPMKFDAFYVSILSEKYKTGKINYLRAFYIGLKSNLKAKRSGQFSSLIYVLKSTKT